MDQMVFPTWLAVALFHPDVAVVLRHTSLRVQEGHAHAAFGTEAGIVAAAVFDGLPIELVAEPERGQTGSQRTWQVNSQIDRQEDTKTEISCDLFNVMHQAHYHLLLQQLPHSFNI